MSPNNNAGDVATWMKSHGKRMKAIAETRRSARAAEESRGDRGRGGGGDAAKRTHDEGDLTRDKGDRTRDNKGDVFKKQRLDFKDQLARMEQYMFSRKPTTTTTGAGGGAGSNATPKQAKPSEVDFDRWSHSQIKNPARPDHRLAAKKKQPEPTKARMMVASQLPAEPEVATMDVDELREKGLLEFPPGVGNKRALPHQQRAVEKFARSRCLLLWYDCGSGKTLAAGMCIRAALETGVVKRALVAVKPALVQQWIDVLGDVLGRDDERVVVTTYKKGLMKYIDPTFETDDDWCVVIDESAMMKSRIKKAQHDGKKCLIEAALMAVAHKSTKRALLLSATPVVNDPKDLCNVAGAFRGLSDYAQVNLVYKKASTAIDYLARGGFVDVHMLSEQDKADTATPRTTMRTIDFVMDDEYARTYDMYQKEELDARLDTEKKAKKRKRDDDADGGDDGEEDDDEEADDEAADDKGKGDAAAAVPTVPKKRNNAFENKTRRLGNATALETSELKDAPWSPKQQWLKRWLTEERRPGSKFVISTSWEVHGAGIIMTVFEKVGFKSFGVVSGSVKNELRAEIMARFNEGDIECIIFTDAGREGMDLRGGETVILFDPCWNDAKREQAIGRLVRAHAMDAFPPEERVVEVYELVQRKRARTEEEKRQIVEDEDIGEALLESLSADESLVRRSSEKKRFTTHVRSRFLA